MFTEVKLLRQCSIVVESMSPRFTETDSTSDSME